MIKEKKTQSTNSAMFVFGKRNYKFLLIGLGFVVLGFLLMMGGGSDSPDEFNEAIFGFRRLTLAPILILLGFAIEIYAIMSKAKENE
ncbi:MAG: DUF3098 domain-containing protein [Bacteroidales bacterium]|nr:DUF3098 domain-containing protein [Bacteroidales bacterium]